MKLWAEVTKAGNHVLSLWGAMSLMKVNIGGCMVIAVWEIVPPRHHFTHQVTAACWGISPPWCSPAHMATLEMMDWEERNLYRLSDTCHCRCQLSYRVSPVTRKSVQKHPVVAALYLFCRKWSSLVWCYEALCSTICNSHFCSNEFCDFH